MRILAVEPGPRFSVEDVHRGWVRALRHLGCEVVTLNLGDRLDLYELAHIEKDGEWVKAIPTTDAIHMTAKGIETAAFEFWPDVVFITSAFFVPKFTMDILRARGMKVVALFTEQPYELDRELQVAACADYSLINDPTHLERFRAVCPTDYQWHCYDPAVHYPRAPQPEHASDFAFVGTGFPSRVEFFEKVQWEGIDACFAGHWKRLAADSPLRPFIAHDPDDCIDNDDAVKLYSATKMSANLYRKEAQRPELAEGWSLGPREVELAACGTPFLRESRGEGDELLGFLPRFESPTDFGEQLRWWLDRDGAREAIAEKARLALADRTFTESAKRLLHRLEG